ncbi:NAD(P)H-dependent oxidoreductase [Enterobacter asburiae]|uniref:NAD(P)H-dependent oxidoreductase n=1 Tax=Enterobacter asburiae TaxID=61645 RepID=UPI001CBC4DF5|nr:NAD(P)H-dependent oxidoreductase [Enterobacter asburiae]UAN18772.1 NAD(P)H-dependent oxidoreductase [Enterobacter asburiae]
MGENLIILAHPDINKSIYNKKIISGLKHIEGTQIKNIYELYPDFKINTAIEQSDLLHAEKIIFQFPMYWYGAPALLKQWEQYVLTPDLCSGVTGDKLKGKELMISVTGGGSMEEYERKKMDYDVMKLWAPFFYIARYCQMQFHEPVYTNVPYIPTGHENCDLSKVDDIIKPHIEKILKFIEPPNKSRNLN